MFYQLGNEITALFYLKTPRAESLTFPLVLLDDWRQKRKSGLCARKLSDDAGKYGSWIGSFGFSGISGTIEVDWGWAVSSLEPSHCVFDYNRHECAFFHADFPVKPKERRCASFVPFRV